ncbi:GNAT family N-acetyltransferase [Brenneria populi subsp. brevivirga]|uniref:GNAT family N-acetyltransferase n=1 Tax=Brenneria populi TaxID=1505588 RepID=UPI002E19664C|nr:GNAT family N-acetyltransferase [Brenneria populi subsp. brevivirga]
MNSYRIRPASHREIERLLIIEKKAGEIFSSLPGDFLSRLPSDMPTHSVAFYKKSIDEGCCWVIEDDSKIAGFICTENIESEETIHINELDVLYGEQGKGLGRRLLDFIINDAKRKNKKITLTTFSNVPWNAPFYKKAGFRFAHNSELTARLRSLLAEESALGLPLEYRCAMILHS